MKRTKPILGISIGVILTISIVFTTGNPDAFAKQEPQPDFVAKLQGKQQTVPEERGGGHGKAHFWFTNSGDLAYYIEVSKNLTITWDEKSSTGNGDEITKIHLHNQKPGTAGPHVLNIFGLPSEDDDQLEVDVDARTFVGIWDDGDANDLPPVGPSPNDSIPLSNAMEALCDGDLYVNVHSEKHGPGVLRGQIIPTSDACEN